MKNQIGTDWTQIQIDDDVFRYRFRPSNSASIQVVLEVEKLVQGGDLWQETGWLGTKKVCEELMG